MTSQKQLSAEQQEDLITILKKRFTENMNRHAQVDWTAVDETLRANPNALWSLKEMERTGGEPDVIADGTAKTNYHFYDCSAESPQGRRSVCYDREGLESRKEHKPKNNAVDMASEMGIELLTEDQYRELQKFGDFDTKTSSWLQTPPKIRKLGGAIFGDFRFNTVFVYHNGAQAYYAGRGFRGFLKI
ncbi:DUF4256 domain-containing protein [uncultured Gelidibacter sp.]|uniref:DUF4256 domain-containing protein n=1 Tax=uncultured Gelidibacter sp. TaxID=259318 RepID=UPI00262539CB|nr:DUF4256 domain-containing protein [uncultured Gelidibacter sp.]